MFFGFDLIQAIQTLGYPGIFAIILAESGLFFGVSLPGGSLLFTAGLLASQGVLNIFILLATVFTAAVIGDLIGYWFGAWIGPALYRRKDSRFFKQAHLRQASSFFEKHGARTVLLARFIPIIRTFTPIVAGIAGMKYKTFLTYNFLGAVVWGGGYTLLGYFLGEAVPSIEEYIVLIVLGIMVVTFIPFVYHVWQEKKKGAAESARLPAAAIFDLDDTLAESFTPPHERVLEKLFTLAERMPVAIMSGAAFSRIERDILKRVPHKADASNFYVLSDNAARCDVWKGATWETAYSFPLSDDERSGITAAIKEAVEETDIFEGVNPVYRIVDRDTSVAFAAFEDGASRSTKSAWDPDMIKRPKLGNALQEKLPGYEVLIGGKTTIDVVRKGISKAYGVEWLAKELNLPPANMLFVGDAFYEGGNDAAVIPTGIKTHATSGPEETEKLIDEMLR
jgi:membrane-associated protein